MVKGEKDNPISLRQIPFTFGAPFSKDGDNKRVVLERPVSEILKAEGFPLSIGPLQVKSALSDEQRSRQMRENIARKLPEMQPVEAHDRTFILICYGPSLRYMWPQIKEESGDIFTVSGAHDFLIERGIMPKGHIECDPREHKAAFTRNAKEGIDYYIASVCHPKVFENVEGKQVLLWHLDNGPETDEVLKECSPDSFMIMGGITVGLRAIGIGMALGYRKFSIYGMDCSFAADGNHAGFHTGKSQERINIGCFGASYISNLTQVQAARDFLSTAHHLTPQGVEFYVHGDGLLQQMLRNRNNILIYEG